MRHEASEGSEKTWSDGSDEAKRVFASGSTGPDGVRIVSARELLGERRLVQIEHRGEIYTLRITKNDRLILTK